MILAILTDGIKEDAKKHGVPLHKLENFRAEIEEIQSLERFNKHHPSPCLVKSKIFDYNYRLIAMRKPIGEHIVVVLLKIEIRSNRDYKTDLWKDAGSVVEKLFNDQMNEDKLLQWVEKRTKIDPPPLPPRISDSENLFLWESAFPEAIDDITVCESHEWVKNIQEQKVRNHLNRIPAMIMDAFNRMSGDVEIIACKDKQDLKMLTYKSPNSKQCVLLSIRNGACDVELGRLSTEWKDKLANADEDYILRHCRVSYPSLICLDDDVWMAAHSPDDDSENIANLALSPEESEILRSCDTHEGDNTGFPLFINGRAGSGKSTLLQYLFAFSFRRWALVREEQSSEAASLPLYLASNQTLLNVAFESSASILSLNSSQLLEGNTLDQDLLKMLRESFKDNFEFMYSLFDDEGT